MPGQYFAPLTITGGYGTSIANIDEWPPLGDRIQSANINSGATVSGEVSFNASASVGFGRMVFAMYHLGNTSGGWSVSAQLKVAGVNVGSAVGVSRPGFSGAYKMSNHIFPASSNAAVAANPSAVSVSWVATNLHTTQQQHWIDAVGFFIAPHQPLPTISGIDWDDVVEAWDLAVSTATTTEGQLVYMVPALKGAAHLLLTNGSTGYVGATDEIAFTSGWYGTVMELEAGLTSSWEVIICRTPTTIPTSDATSIVIISTHGNQVKGANAVGVPGYKLATAIANRQDSAGGGWIRFVGSVESESNHIRSNDTPLADTRYVLLARNQQSGNEELYRATGPDPIEATDKVIDQDADDETNQRWGVGVGRREDGSRQWTGGFEGFWVLNESLTQAQALEYANTIAALHGLVEGGAPAFSGGGVATVTVTAVGGGKEGHSSGGVASVPIAATGGGTPGTAFSGGGSSSVSVVATGGGTSSAFPSGGGLSPVVVIGNGGGVAREAGRGGGTTVVATTSTGGGTAWWPGSEPEVFAGPWVSKATVVDDRATIAAGS